MCPDKASVTNIEKSHKKTFLMDIDKTRIHWIGYFFMSQDQDIALHDKILYR